MEFIFRIEHFLLDFLLQFVLFVWYVLSVQLFALEQYTVAGASTIFNI